MANTIKMKQSSVAAKVPTTTDLALGELAVNTYDGKLYLKKNVTGTETIVEIGAGGGAGGGSYTISSTAPSSPLSGDRWIDSDTGIEYTYINDGTSSQWVQTVGSSVSIGGSSSITSFVSVAKWGTD